MKNVMIPYDAFIKLIRFHLLDDESERDDIKDFLESKVDSLTRRELYSKSKTAPTEEEREAYRNKYLDAIGMHQDFRW